MTNGCEWSVSIVDKHCRWIRARQNTSNQAPSLYIDGSHPLTSDWGAVVRLMGVLSYVNSKPKLVVAVECEIGIKQMAFVSKQPTTLKATFQHCWKLVVQLQVYPWVSDCARWVSDVRRGLAARLEEDTGAISKARMNKRTQVA